MTWAIVLIGGDRRVELSLLAFFTHLALFLHKTGDLEDPNALEVLTKQYLEMLIKKKQSSHELAALYCSELPEGREESFEQYLRGESAYELPGCPLLTASFIR